MINYYLLMKPGIILGNLVTVAAGFLLASKGNIDPLLFLWTLLGLALIMGSGCVFNNYIDLTIDSKMERTKNRPLVLGLIGLKEALVFGSFLLIFGNLVLISQTNLLTSVIADLGFVVYVLLYSLWKGHTIYGTAIGSVAGAIPPVVGYCAVSNHFDLGAMLLFTMMVLWQMPHFFAIALFRMEDYAKANIPVLPLVEGIFKTKIHMVIYIVGFMLSAILLSVFGYTGTLFVSVVTLLGLLWLSLSLIGFKMHNEKVWGKQMFQLSLFVIVALCFAIPFDVRG